jgi:cellulose synthase/poly-beta-1,6-N-acetylglucosamine synthase-like glycosyltransferase
MNPYLERKMTLICLTVTAALYGLFLAGFFRGLWTPAQSAVSIAESVFFLVLVVSLLWGNFLYQFARYGYFSRKAAYHSLCREKLERCYQDPAPSSITVLIPSYKEELHVLQQTILSAALLDYPARRIVVLIDNPPNVTGRDLKELRATRALIKDVNALFAALAGPFARECDRFFSRKEKAASTPEAERLASLYEKAADRLDLWAESYPAAGAAAFAHHDKLFVTNVLKALAEDHRERALGLASASPDMERLAREYRRLAALFRVEITSFERKRYINLSHEPNKAMNLNSYIGLMGRSFREVRCNHDLWLEEYFEAESDFSVPESDYVLTLDADSIVLPDYALRLAQVMDSDPSIAVAQTPYSAFPGAPETLERIAGATTDLQYIVHQGFTSCGATYWVGANALLRLDALRDIKEQVEERGHSVSVFIQDRTVIEDTESTVDLISRGWTLFNYPERLAYSATPPDFGSLVIQRRRWANGGLIILPKLLRYLRKSSRFNRVRPSEAFMRTHYLCSPAAGSFGLLAVLLYPFDDSLTSIWLIATAAPYYFLYGRDLRQCGYGTPDLLRVYALILLLLPVNLSGVLRSLRQIMTGRKSAFGRTPKVEGRTASPLRHVLFQWAISAFLVLQSASAFQEGRYGHAAFAIANLAALLYAITYFLGWRNAWTDVTTALKLRPEPHSHLPAKAYSLGSVQAAKGKDRFNEALAISQNERG